jgi:ligand-binding sensor domain-containing protein/two-component sensor histidine kinase
VPPKQVVLKCGKICLRNDHGNKDVNRSHFLSFVPVFLLLANLSCFALDPTRKLSDYLQVNFDSEKGLPEDTVLSIAQSPDGYLWFGGYHGISRFDGNRFVSLNDLSETHVTIRTVGFLFFDSKGALWIGTFNGLYRFDGKAVYKFTEKDGVPDSLFYSAMEDDLGNVWISSGDGLLKWGGNKFTLLDQSKNPMLRYVHVSYADSDGSIWIGTQDGLLVLRNEKFETYTKKDGLSNNAVWAVVQDKQGNHWIGTEGGLSEFQNGKFTNYDKSNGLAENIVNTLRFDQHGVLWIGTEGGLSRFYNGKIESISAKDGLSKDSVWALQEDDEGNLWVGINYGGVSRFSDGRVQVLGKKEGLASDTVTAVLEDSNGTMWIGTDNGLNRISDGSISLLTTKDGLRSDVISSLYEDSHGTMWVGTHEGLTQINSNKIVSFTTADGLKDPVVLVISEDREKNLWIGTNMGLNQWKDDRLISVDDWLKGTVAWITPSKDGGFWSGTYAGILRYANGKLQEFNPSNNPMKGLEISTLYEEESGKIWIGTFTAGLWSYYKGKFSTFRSEDGIYTDTISNILEDSKGYLWLGSSDGIVRVSKQELEKFAEKKTTRIQALHFGTSDGMRKAECYDQQQPTAWKTKNGTLWFATLGGAAIVDPLKIKSNPYPPKCKIEKMMINEKQIDTDRTQVLPPGSSNFEFQYTALSFTAPEKIQFRYQLAGFDKDWIDAGSRRLAQYTNIPPGNYTFHLKACNNDGLWNEAGAAFLFTIRPYFYQTRWFYALVASVLAFGVWQFHKYRVQRALEIERIRTRIATDLHDDIGAGLSQIAILTEVARKDLQKPETPVRLNQVMTTAQELMESMSDIVWAVNPARDNAEDLVHRMRKFANDILSAGDTELHFQSIDTDKTRKLTPDFKRHVYLIFKECINNAAKHSQCKSVTIEINMNRGQMVLKISDDGKGFDMSNSYDGNGLKSMRTRAGLLGGTLRFHSEPGKGTSMELEVPFKHKVAPESEVGTARKIFRAARWN